MGPHQLSTRWTENTHRARHRLSKATCFVLSVGLVAVFSSLWARAAWAQAPVQVKRCFDKAFTTQAFLIDPQNNYFDNTTVWADVTTKRQRVDIQIFNPEPLNTTVLLRYDTGVGYQFEENGLNCFSFFLTTDLTQFCFSDEATITGRPVVTGKRLTEITDPLPDGKTSVYTVVDEVASTAHCPDLAPGEKCRRAVLHKVFTRDGQLLVNFQEYFNYRKNVLDQSVFDVPAGCPPPT